MNYILNINSLIENNADYIFKLVVTIVGSLLAIIPIILQIKSNRTNKVFEEIISKRLKSHENLLKFLANIPKKELFINDYKKCKLIWKNENIIPNYYCMFENISSLINFKKELDLKVLQDYTLNYKVYKSLFLMQSYIDTCILWYKINSKFIEEVPNIKFFLSLDFHKLIKETYFELNKFYNNKNFQKFSKTPRFNWLYKKYVKLDFMFKCREYNIKLIQKLKEDRINKNLDNDFLIKYNCCVNCKNTCVLKVKKK